MKHLFLPFLLATLLIVSCQKDQKQTPAATGVTKHVYSYTDTVTQLTTSVQSNSGKVLDADAIPISWIQLNYLGVTYPSTLGTYRIAAYNNRDGKTFDCDYSLFTQSGTPVAIAGYQNPYLINSTAQGFQFTMTPAVGPYVVDVAYLSGNTSGTTTPTPFTIYSEPLPPSGLLAFYRYVGDELSGNHFYNSDWQELASGANGFYFEMVQGYLYPGLSSAPSLAPLYRFYDAATGDHCYTNGTSELGGNSSYVNEGITGYISNVAQGNFTTPLNRWFNGKWHFFCSPPENPTSSGYHEEGLVGYIQAPN